MSGSVRTGRSRLAAVLEERGLLEAGASFTADFHVHSIISDGSEDVETLVRAAAASGLTHIAFTNHDTTRGVDTAIRAGRAAGVRVVGGIEVSAYDPLRERKVHIVGLGMREDAPACAQLCGPTLAAREANTRWQLDRLLETGHAVRQDVVEAWAARSTCLYKQHLMAALTDEPYTSSAYQALYRSLFKGDGPCARDIAYVDARDAVAAIVEDGGLPVLAHPGQLDSWDFVPDLVRCGLAGIEERHPDHGSADEARARELAEAHGLFLSGGSDYHGAFGAPPSVGFRRIAG